MNVSDRPVMFSPHSNPARALNGGKSIRLHAPAACILILIAAIACCIPKPLAAQGMPTASRIGDLQIGGGFIFGKSNYNFQPSNLVGGTAYASFDFRPHLGLELDFHQSHPTSDSTVYERTYEVGPRYNLAYGRFVPYVKGMYGRGVYNFPSSVANIAYNIYTLGGGLDVRVTHILNVRCDYEYQTWPGFPLATLHPSVITIGVAYHFPQDSRRPVFR